jgi:hypothetical protein
MKWRIMLPPFDSPFAKLRVRSGYAQGTLRESEIKIRKEKHRSS